MGGTGGGILVRGGDGGAGYILLQNSMHSLKTSSFANTTYPPINEMSLGVFPAQSGESLAQSMFYFAKVSRPDYYPDTTGLTVEYEMDMYNENTHVTQSRVPLEFPNVLPDLNPAPLFEIKFNACKADDDGFIDWNEVNGDFRDYTEFDDVDPVTLEPYFTNKPYMRFKIKLWSEKSGVVILGQPYTCSSLRVKRIVINRSQVFN